MIQHPDIQPKNILLGVLDDAAFVQFEHEATHNPLPQKELPDRTIYTSQPMPLTKGVPSLSDLSEARFNRSDNTDVVMPDVYRAPEVVLGLPWSYPIDTWGFAMTVRETFAVETEQNGRRAKWLTPLTAVGCFPAEKTV